MAKRIAALAIDKKAENVVVLQMGEIVNYCDYFVICSATTGRHVRAVASGVEQGLDELGVNVRLKQGLDSASRSRGFTFSEGHAVQDELSAGAWVLLDLGDIVVHVFEGSTREFYALDFLWKEAVQIDWQKK
ncbi:MAG: RsfS/YbeB/iojap family protein [Candidatus Omnitrophica bacterium]|nr:RsfS/YbeB/iojap family protein [Candidatus Omnitrophota bacterium]